jgi:3-oxoacyl-[acyl-carrier protein] reductase
VPSLGGPADCDDQARLIGTGGLVDEPLRVPGEVRYPDHEVSGARVLAGESPVAVVCGGSAGIGLACAEGLAALGFSVAILGRDRGRLEGALAVLADRGFTGCDAWSVDVTDSLQVADAFASIGNRYGHVNSLVNSVGPTVAGSIATLDDQDWVKAFDQGALTAVRTIRAVLPLMRNAPWGRIVNLTAMSTQHQTPGLIAYTASKAALASITKNLARDLAADDILVNAVAPGSVLSEKVAGAVRSAGGDPSDLIDSYRVMAERFGAHIDLGRVAVPAEVASVVVFCASQANTFMTGAHINVDGGSDFT